MRARACVCVCIDAYAALPAQLLVNEGSLYMARMQGGDASNDAREHAFFNVKHVPEVFAYFDALSYELSKLDLSPFRRGAMRNDIVGSDNIAQSV